MGLLPAFDPANWGTGAAWASVAVAAAGFAFGGYQLRRKAEQDERALAENVEFWRDSNPERLRIRNGNDSAIRQVSAYYKIDKRTISLPLEHRVIEGKQETSGPFPPNETPASRDIYIQFIDARSQLWKIDAGRRKRRRVRRKRHPMGP